MNLQTLTTTQAVDAVFLYIFGIAALLLIGITAVMIWFIVRYHRRRHPRPDPSPSSSFLLELIWTLVPTLIVLSMFWYSWNGYLALVNVPADALKVEVTARQWSWTFTYANGKTSDRLVVPAGKAVRLAITSEDVLHSLYIPAFRIKKDAVPGITTYLWFRASEPSTHDLFCAEYCGAAHSAMITTVEALPEKEFEKWLSETGKPAAGTEGQSLLARYGCNACHSLDGTKMIGPTFSGLFGRRITVQTDGKTRDLVVDRDYVRRSILEPGADLVTGYPPVMPSFKDRMTADDLEALVEFLTGTTDSETPSE